MVEELSDFDFSASPVNGPLVRELATGAFLESKRNVVLVGIYPIPMRSCAGQCAARRLKSWFRPDTLSFSKTCLRCVRTVV